MIRGLYTASSGMQVEQVRQDVIANNLANVHTSGFRRDFATLEARGKMGIKRTHDPVSADPLARTRKQGIGDLGVGALVNRIHKRFEHGVIRQTDNPYDLALEGDGFFTVADANGEKLYTRGGEFTRNKDGMLVDKENRLLLGRSGPINIPAGGTLTVGTDGSLAINGRTFDLLALARFENPDAELEKRGDTNFRYRGVGEPAATTTTTVMQGAVEGPNVNGISEMVEMIAVLRHYEANQKVLQAEDEMLGKAVNDVARG